MLLYLIQYNPNALKQLKYDEYDIVNYKTVLEQYEKSFSFNTENPINLIKNEFRYIDPNENTNNLINIHFANTMILLKYIYSNYRYDDTKEIINDLSETIVNIFLKTIYSYFSYDSFEKQAYNTILIEYLNGNISLTDIMYELYKHFNPKEVSIKLLLQAKYGNHETMKEGLTSRAIMLVKPQKINHIYNLIITKYPELKNHFGEEYEYKLKNILIKMSTTLTINSTYNIIQHLLNDSTSIVNLLECFSKIDLSFIFGKTDIKANQQFINFFTSDIKDKNSLIRRICDGDPDALLIGNNIQYLYKYWDSTMANYTGGKRRLAFIIDRIRYGKITLNPDEVKLEGAIIDSYVDDTRWQSLPIDEAIAQTRILYSSMKHNFQKSIPYVSGSFNGIEYETLKANDPVLLELGSKTRCCFKIGGEASSFVKYCANNQNGRVLIFRENGKIIGMAPMIRNGRLILYNSIESEYINDNEKMNQLFSVLEKASKEIIDNSSKQENNESIVGALIGNYKNNQTIETREYQRIIPLSDHERMLLKPLDNNEYINHIEPLYTNINKAGICLYSLFGDIDLSELYSFIPTACYNDPRCEPILIDNPTTTELNNIYPILNDIHYETDKQNFDISNIQQIVYSDDWFIAITHDGEEICRIVGEDDRAITEMHIYRDELYTLNNTHLKK